MNNIEDTPREIVISPETETGHTFGLIMVKPRALREGRNEAIEKIFENEENTLGLDDSMYEKLRNVSICAKFTRDVDPDEIMDVFYKKDKSGRHGKDLKNLFRNKQVMFLLLEYPGSSDELKVVLNAIKKPIREQLAPHITYRKFEKYPLDMNPPHRNFYLQQTMDNVIHTSDSEEEVAKALSKWLSDSDRKEMAEQGIDIDSFMESHRGAGTP